MSDDESTAPLPSPVSALPVTARPYRFTWDAATRRQGPESVSGTTDARGGADYFAAQPRIGLYPSTLTLAPNAIPQDWSSATHGFHAISTVLNNPHKRQAPPKAHSHLPAVVPADLPRVRRKDFDSYLRAISPEWVRFQHSLTQGRDGVPNPPSGIRSVPPLDTVPQVFFDQSFTLSDHRTFNAVTSDADPTSLAHALPLLEKFSHYADTVEQHLVLEISHRAPSFFAALTNLHDLHAESEHCLERIASLRSLLTDLDTNSAKKGLDLIRRQSRAANVATINNGVKHVASVVEMGRVARALVGAGQWGQALGVIQEMDSMWQDQTTPEIDSRTSIMPTLAEEDEDAPPKKPLQIPLSSLRAFSALPDHLRALTMEIAASLALELVSVLRDDLTVRKDRNTDPDLRDRLRPLILGLVPTRGVKEGLLSWREVVLNYVRQIIRARLPEPEDEGNEEAKAANRAYLRDMRHPEFVLLLQDLYAELLGCIEGLQSQSTVIVSILEAESGKHKELGPPPTTGTNTSLTPTQAHDTLADLLTSTSELSSSLISSLLSPRSEAHAALELPDFLALFTPTWAFVVKSEVLCGRMIVSLRGAAVSAAKLFLGAFHGRRIERGARLVEEEKWEVVEITGGCQRIVNVLVGGAVGDREELWVREGVVDEGSGMSSHTPADTPPQHLLKPAANGNGNGKPTGFAPVKSLPNAKHLRIEEHTYFAVSATTEVLVLLLDYLRVVVNLPMLTTDVMSRVIEFLKAFNSRTCQVVLGAGAMRSAGLKNITAKHLALASQSLSIMFELIPYVRETFRRHLSPKQAVMLTEFDKLKRDYQEHQNEIHSKLIAIMGDRLTAHIKSLQAVDWTVPKPGGGVNDYIEILVKETVTLHKVLSRYLSPAVVEYVMTQVFAAINHGLSEEYGRIELPHQEAKTRLLADAKYLHQKLSALKNVAAPSGMLVTVIQEKSLPRTGPASPLPQSPEPAPLPTPTRSMTLGSANQRLKGLLSGNKSSFEKALPPPMRTSSLAASPVLSPPPPPQQQLSRPGSPVSASTSSLALAPPPLPSMNGGTTVRRPSTSSSSSSSVPSLPQAQTQTRKASAGFKQVELPPLPSSNGSPDPGPRPEGTAADAHAKAPDMVQRTLSPPLPPTPHDTPTPPEPALTEPELAPQTGVLDPEKSRVEGISGSRSGGEEARSSGVMEAAVSIESRMETGTEAVLLGSGEAGVGAPDSIQSLSDASDVGVPSSGFSPSSPVPSSPVLPRSESPLPVDGIEL
ncbi:hypothetical protein C0991_010431 [Blastosporella zonata]|nr:hypothetical protein C0991_010431 [Blastosporella zonata]